MTPRKLPFCNITRLDDSIAEVIVNEGVEINLEMVEDYHAWIDENLAQSCGLLVNKINTYSYSFGAQRKIPNSPKIKAIAVISYSKMSDISTEVLTKIPRDQEINLRVFGTRNEALEWLQLELSK